MMGNWQPLEEAVPADLFKAEVHAWARRLKVEPRALRIVPMRRKWASCSSAGRLSFNRELLRQPAQFRAEVVVHELLHLKIPNHGRVFRALLRAYLASRTCSPVTPTSNAKARPPH
jgi:predicted metal-dependent hydrolase